jgi:hypothetical protein
MKIAPRLLWATAAVMTALISNQASAGTSLVVQMDQSQLMQLAADPGSIIIGNPSIADVSLNGRQLFIHGHSFGETNLMIFDTTGKKIGDYDVTVSHDSENQLSLFLGNATKGASRFSYSCAPNCEASMMVGDDPTQMQQILANNRNKVSFATGTSAVDTGGGNAGGAAAPAPSAAAN